jgi:hypothetical protein
MALLKDGHAASVEDLSALDSSVVKAAEAEGISLADKLVVAWTDIELEIAAMLSRRTAAVEQIEHQLRKVVVTPLVKKWHVVLTLAHFYGDAYAVELNNRYLKRHAEFSRLAKDTSQAVRDLGLGMVEHPVPKARKPNVTSTIGFGMVDPLFIRVAWRNARGQSGAPSDTVVFHGSESMVPVVRVSNCPAECVGFDVFVGQTENDVRRQTEVPLRIDDVWALPPGGLVDGDAPSNGQTPEYFIKPGRVF